MKLLALCVLALAASAHADDRAEARAFFDSYVERGKSFDPTLGELYSPDARIITLRDATHRMELTGRQWAELISQAMPIAEKRGDVSTYDDIKISPHETGFRITANRMSAVKCVRDDNYHMNVAKIDDSWRIVEEYSETVSLSQCKPSTRLSKSLKTLQQGITPHLPLDLDADSRLESVEIVGPALIYHQRLHTSSVSELDLAHARDTLRKVGFQSACGAADMRALVDQGATIRYSTVDRDGALIATVDIAPGMCP